MRPDAAPVEPRRDVEIRDVAVSGVLNVGSIHGPVTTTVHATPQGARSRSATRVFVSHASVDRRLAAAVVQVLGTGVAGLAPSQIFCTSLPDHSPTAGREVDPTLRAGIENAKVLVALLTPSALASTYVLFELGAAWVAQRMIVPLRSHRSVRLEGPLRSRFALDADHPRDAERLAEAVAEELGLVTRNTAEFRHAVCALVREARAVAAS